MPEQFNSGRPGRFKGIGVLGRTGRFRVHGTPLIFPGKNPKSYVYNRGFDNSFLLVTEDLTNTITGIETITDAGVETLTSSSAATQSLTELLNEINLGAFQSVAVNTQSLVELLREINLGAFQSVGVHVGSVSELVSDVLDQVAVQVGSLVETAQEGVESAAAASQDLAEVAADLLALVSSAQNTAALSEVEVDDLTSLASAIQEMADVAVENLVSFKAGTHSILDSGYIAGPVTIADSLASSALYTATLADVVIAAPEPEPVMPPSPSPGFISVGLLPGRSVDHAKIEAHAEKLLEGNTLPESYPIGAHKAWNGMIDFYGEDDGKRIFIKKAIERGEGDNLRDMIADVYKKGATVGDKKLDTQVQVRGPKPIVRIIIR